MSASGTKSRNAVFQLLKPPCVALNQAFLSFQGHKSPSSQVVDRLEHVLKALRALGAQQLDPKLAEYVFIPLSYIIKASSQLPIRASEATFECLAVLLDQGWREHVAGALATQLLILLSITADQDRRDPAVQRKVTNELLASVYKCMGHLFHYLGQTSQGKAQLVDKSATASVGHTLSVILGGVGPSNESGVQLSAAHALNQFLGSTADRDLLASFLPGVISSLTKTLTPSAGARSSWAVLCEALAAFRTIISKTITDRLTEPFLGERSEEGNSKLPTAVRTASWLRASSGQLKLALANVNRLHAHSRVDVRSSLFDVNVLILRDCSISLSECRQLALETSIVITAQPDMEVAPTFASLLIHHQELANTLQSTCRDWLASLPRILAGSDDEGKTRRLKQIRTAYDILSDIGTDMHTVKELLSTALPELVTLVMRTPSKDKTAISQGPVVQIEDLPVALRTDQSVSFMDVLSTSRQQESLLGLIHEQLDRLCANAHGPGIARSFLDLARNSGGDLQVAAMWLATVVVRGGQTPIVDDLIEWSGDDSSPLWRHQFLDDLYDLSLAQLEDDDDDTNDWRVKALGLEIVALQADAMKNDFRNELIDALYPVLRLLGSSAPRLRRHAMSCLNSLTSSCGYPDAKSLVVNNADYLVNAIALKLNAFDVAPEGPQVLLMMVKLAGPSLLPFLNDTVDSIFAVLDDYHGYTSLVELLFAVLGAMAEQGAREPQLQIEPGQKIETTPDLTTLSSLAAELRKRRARFIASHEISEAGGSQPRTLAPQRPWSESEAAKNNESNMTTGPDQSAHSLEAAADASRETIPAKPTYDLLLRIANQTAHYLPSPSANLRASLLQLLSAHLFPALAAHENSLLPLINTLWPEVTNRLSDDEPRVVAAALAAMAAMGRSAGGFMRGRFDAVWPALHIVEDRVRALVLGDRSPGSSSVALGLTQRQTRSNAWSASVRGGAGRESQAPTHINRGRSGGQALVPVGTVLAAAPYVEPAAQVLWVALRDLLIVVIGDVGVKDELFEDALGMLRPLDRLSAEQTAVLERFDADTLWLVRYKDDASTLVVPDRLKVSTERWAGVEA